MRLRSAPFVALSLLLAGCVAVPEATSAPEQFFARVHALCGRAFEGRMISNDPADGDMAGKPMVMHVRTCSENEIRIPFVVGTDRSRTWVISRTTEGLQLSHVHRHEDGTEDVRSRYGGTASVPGTALRQAFPADAFSRALFVREGIPASTANVWALEVEPARLFAYELTRPERRFRVEFDLSRQVPAPPSSWGER